ncbi:hypothetical protein J6590_069407 [Homalodisca vitripennis]|nr:hypothetical protein J6590_069407 [Homalodisca vitripennis]
MTDVLINERQVSEEDLALQDLVMAAVCDDGSHKISYSTLMMFGTWLRLLYAMMAPARSAVRYRKSMGLGYGCCMRCWLPQDQLSDIDDVWDLVMGAVCDDGSCKISCPLPKKYGTWLRLLYAMLAPTRSAVRH